METPLHKRPLMDLAASVTLGSLPPSEQAQQVPVEAIFGSQSRPNAAVRLDRELLGPQPKLRTFAAWVQFVLTRKLSE